MKARVTRWSFAAAALVAFLALPGVATARPTPRVRVTPPAIDQEIVEQGSNGFSIRIGVHDRRRLQLTASKLGLGLSFQTVTYEMPIRPSSDPTEIEARLGELGRLDMHFEPEKVKRTPPGGTCTGERIVEEEGFWSGFLAFRGEAGFTDVRVHGALGSVVRTPSLRCRPSKKPDSAKLKRRLKRLERELKELEAEGDGGPAVRGIKLEATARERKVTFAAQRLATGTGRKKSSESTLVATATRSRGPIREAGGVGEFLAPGSYLKPADSTDPLAEFVVEPGELFSGSATYRKRPGERPTWSGDLKVAIPGFGDVGLAGRRSRAVACESLFTECEGGLETGPSALLHPTAAWSALH